MSVEIVTLAADLYEFVESSAPARAETEERRRTLRELAADLAIRFSEKEARVADTLNELIAEIAANLLALAEALTCAQNHRELKARWHTLGQNYEAMVDQIKRRGLPVPEGVHLFHLKPQNYWRNLFHVGNGLVGITCYELFGPTGAIYVAASVLLTFVCLDTTRRVFPRTNVWIVETLFGKIARPSDAHKVPSATWYITALLIALIILPGRAVELGLVVLAFGDPAAALIGRRFGRVRIFGQKTFAGAAGFFVSATVFGWLFLVIFEPTLAALTGLGVCAAAAFVGAVAELVSEKLDDNATVPLLAGGLAALLLVL